MNHTFISIIQLMAMQLVDPLTGSFMHINQVGILIILLLLVLLFYLVRSRKALEQKSRKSEKEARRNIILVDVLSRHFEDKQEQLDYVLNQALLLTDSRLGYIYIYDEENEQFILNSWSDGVMAECAVTEPQTVYLLAQTGIWGEVIRQRQPIIVNDFQQEHPLKKGYPAGHAVLHRYMSIPVIIDSRIVAVLGLANKEDPYDETDVSEMKILMSGVWNAVIRRETQESLDLERNKYLQTLVAIGDGVMVVDQDGRIEMLNNIAQRLTGWTNQDARNRHYQDVLLLSHEDKNKVIRDPIASVFHSDKIEQLEGHALLTSKDGSVYFLEDSVAPVKDDSNKTVGVVMVFRDITEKKKQRDQIRQLSFNDPLTGLYNRRFFEEELKRLDTQRNLPLSILLGDVNGLKLTNDVFGHTYGDALLQKIARVFRRVCRADDIVARWGGDEFVLLLPQTTSEEAERVRIRIKYEFGREKIEALKGSISIGCATKLDTEDILDILDDAEEAMYMEKAVERDTFRGEAIQAILQNLHQKSQRELEHSEEVSRLCVRLGQHLDLSEIELRKLKDAGYLHDIGKVVLDSEYLGRSYNLSREEANAIKRHPIVGYRILSAFDETVDLADYVLSHQEYWDGSGYPKGLRGKQIPMLARIITLIESFERMINDPDPVIRKSPAQALVYIKENAGKQFDPELVWQFTMLDH